MHISKVPDLKTPYYNLMALTVFAGVLGDQANVRITIGGDGAYTDGQQINVPAFEPRDQAERDATYGYLVHEAGHVRCTDFRTYGMARTPLEASILNIIEDPRIERGMADLYPGAPTMLSAALRKVAAQGGMDPPQAGAHPAQVLSGYLLLQLRSELPGQEFLAPMAAEARKVLLATFSKECVTKLDRIMRQTRTFSLGRAGTEQALKAARKVIALLEEERDKQPEQPQPQDGQQGDQGQQSQDSQQGGQGQDQQGQSGGDQQGTSSDDQSGQGGQSGDQKQDSGTDGSDNSQGGQNGDQRNKTGDGSGANDGKDQAAQQGAAGDSADQASGSDNASGDQGKPDGSGGDGQSGQQDSAQAGQSGQADKGDQAGQSSGASSSPDQSQDGSTGTAPGAGKTGGKRVSDQDAKDAAASALGAGSSDVAADPFRVLAGEIDAAAKQAPAVLRRKITVFPPKQDGTCRVSRQDALASSGALRRSLQVLLEAEAKTSKRQTFAGRVNARSLWKVKTEAQPRVFTKRTHHRATNTAVHLLVDQSSSMKNEDRMKMATEAAAALAAAIQPMRHATVELTAFPQHGPNGASGVRTLIRRGQPVPQGVYTTPHGSTPMAEAMHHAATELMMSARTAERRILIIVTDGLPSCIPSVQEMQKRIEALGVEIVPIGIADDRIRNVFRWCNLTYVNFVRGGAFAGPSVGRAPRMGYPPFRFSTSPKENRTCRTPRVRLSPR